MTLQHDFTWTLQHDFTWTLQYDFTLKTVDGILVNKSYCIFFLKHNSCDAKRMIRYNFINADRSFVLFGTVGSFCVGKMNYEGNGCGNAFMRKYLI